MKKLYWLLAAALVLSMILTACGQAATPTEAAAPAAGTKDNPIKLK